MKKNKASAPKGTSLIRIPMPVRYVINLVLIVAVWFLFTSLISAGVISNYWTGILIMVGINIILAVSLNIATGYLGQLPLGHAGFMAVGAYAGGIFMKAVPAAELLKAGNTAAVIPFILIALLISAVVAGIFGIIIGIPVLRLKGDYLAIVTLAFGEIIKNLINVMYVGLDSNGFHFSIKDTTSLGMGADGVVIIKGAQGITGTPKAATFTVGIILVLITLFIVLNLINSRTGRAIMSIRDNRIAAESVGINITKYKLMAFAISAALAGVAGVLYAHNLSSLAATPKNFGYNMSIMILVYVVLGGIGSIRGSVISTVILYLLPELLRGLNNYRMLIYAIVLILAMLFNSAPQFITLRKRIFDGLKPQHAAHSGKEEA